MPAGYQSSALSTAIAIIFLTANFTDLHAQTVIDSSPDDYPRLTFNHRGPSGRVHALAFADSPTRLYVAGEDKVVDVFFVDGEPGQRPQTAHATTLRWEQSRGALGQIYDMALANKRNLLAIGGFSARNSGGDLALFSSQSGKSEGVLPSTIRYSKDETNPLPENCHLSTVSALAVSPSGNRLISADTYAVTRVWDISKHTSQQIDSSVQLRGPHEGRYTGTRFPVMMISDQYAMTVEPTDWNAPQTSESTSTIYYYNLKDGSKHKVLSGPGQVRSLVRNSNCSFYAACFEPSRGTPLAYVSKTGQQAKQLDVSDLQIVRLIFGSDDQLVVSGVRRSDQAPILRFYRGRRFPEENDFRLVYEKREAAELGSAEVLSMSSDGRFLARYSARQRAVMVYQVPVNKEPAALNDVSAPTPLQSSGARYMTAVFSNDNRYRLALNTDFKQPNPANADCYFDLPDMRRRFDSRIRRSKWQHPNGFVDGWQLKPKPDGSFLISNGSDQKWQLMLRPEQGSPTARCRFSPDDSNDEFLAIATRKTNGIYIYSLPDNGDRAILIRYFRDHTGVISSLNASPDASLLVSASLDRSVKIWSLKDLSNAAATPLAEQRLGAVFQKNGNAGLVVSELQSNGILAARGFHKGSSIERIRYKETTVDLAGKVATSANQMLNAIVRSPPEMELVADIREPSGTIRIVRFTPGWEPLATLYITRNGDWACAAPSGYFASSDGNGDDLLVWQQSLKRTQPVKLARGRELSAQFKKAQVLKDLIEHQDLEKSLLDVGRSASEELTQTGAALSAAFAADAEIRITEPDVGVVAGDDDEISISADVRVPADDSFDDYYADAFVNGQFIGRHQLDSAKDTNAQNDAVTVHWKSPPFAPVNRVRVILKKHRSDSAGLYKFDETAFVSTIRPELPRVHSLVVGANAYSGVLPSLNYARQDAETVSAIVRGLADKEHTGLSILLTDETETKVSGTAISAAIETLKQEIINGVGPQQLVVFLAGHGKQVDVNGQYYFLPPDVTTYDDVESKGIAWSQFESLSTLPCRKLFIIDTCDSGTVAGSALVDQSQAGRAAQELSDSQIVVIAATAETGTARELAGFQHGALTQCLIEGIQEGKADGCVESESRDRIVTLRELAEYVQKRLPAITEEVHNVAQLPTIAPGELLNIQSIPLRIIAP